MRGLRGRNHVERVIRKGCCFRSADNASKFWEGGKIFFAGPAHLGVWFDANDLIAIFEKQPREKPSAKGNVRDERLWPEAAFRPKKLDRFSGIGWPETHVILNA